LVSRGGGITKAGRHDLRTVLVEAAQVASQRDPRWRAELQRLEPRTGRNKAIVAIARKMLVVIWHLLTKEVADRQADPERLARKYLEFAYTLNKQQRNQPALDYVRSQLDLVGIGQDMDCFRAGKRRYPLPPSAAKKVKT